MWIQTFHSTANTRARGSTIWDGPIFELWLYVYLYVLYNTSISPLGGQHVNLTAPSHHGRVDLSYNKLGADSWLGCKGLKNPPSPILCTLLLHGAPNSKRVAVEEGFATSAGSSWRWWLGAQGKRRMRSLTLLTPKSHSCSFFCDLRLLPKSRTKHCHVLSPNAGYWHQWIGPHPCTSHT